MHLHVLDKADQLKDWNENEVFALILCIDVVVGEREEVIIPLQVLCKNLLGGRSPSETVEWQCRFSFSQRPSFSVNIFCSIVVTEAPVFC